MSKRGGLRLGNKKTAEERKRMDETLRRIQKEMKREKLAEDAKPEPKQWEDGDDFSVRDFIQ